VTVASAPGQPRLTVVYRGPAGWLGWTLVSGRWYRRAE